MEDDNNNDNYDDVIGADYNAIDPNDNAINPELEPNEDFLNEENRYNQDEKEFSPEDVERIYYCLCEGNGVYEFNVEQFESYIEQKNINEVEEPQRTYMEKIRNHIEEKKSMGENPYENSQNANNLNNNTPSNPYASNDNRSNNSLGSSSLNNDSNSNKAPPNEEKQTTESFQERHERLCYEDGCKRTPKKDGSIRYDYKDGTSVTVTKDGIQHDVNYVKEKNWLGRSVYRDSNTGEKISKKEAKKRSTCCEERDERIIKGKTSDGNYNKKKKSPKARTGKTIYKTGKAVSSVGKGMRKLGTGTKKIAQGLNKAAIAIKKAAKAARKVAKTIINSGRSLISSGASLCSTGIGAIAGVPMVVAGSAMVAAGAAAYTATYALDAAAFALKVTSKITNGIGIMMEKSGNRIEKSGQKMQVQGNQMYRSATGKEIGKVDMPQMSCENGLNTSDLINNSKAPLNIDNTPKEKDPPKGGEKEKGKDIENKNKDNLNTNQGNDKERKEEKTKEDAQLRLRIDELRGINREQSKKNNDISRSQTNVPKQNINTSNEDKNESKGSIKKDKARMLQEIRGIIQPKNHNPNRRPNNNQQMPRPPLAMSKVTGR